MKFKKTLVATSILTSLFLFGCGDNNDSNNQPQAKAENIKITAIDGYLKNALLCADINKDGKCAVDELIKDVDGKYLLTNDKGNFGDALVSSTAKAKLENFPQIIATIQSFDPKAKLLTQDMDTPSVAMKPVVLRAPAGSTVVSPLTDMIVAKMQTAEQPITKKEAEQQVIASLNGLAGTDETINTETLYANYVAAPKSDVLAKKLHKTAQILTETKANAVSEKAFDEQLNYVTSKSVGEVQTIVAKDIDKLSDNNYKPFVPVGDDTAKNPQQIIINTVAQFSRSQIQAFAAALTEQTQELYGDADYWQDVIVDFDTSDLVNDPDANGQNALTIANTEQLKAANLKITLTDSGLIVSRIDPKKVVVLNSYDIKIATNDVDSEGKVIDGNAVSSMPLTFKVKSYNYAPEVNHQTQNAIQKQISRLNLEINTVIDETRIALNDLFSDKNGNELTLSAETSSEGLTVKIDGNDLIISGTPVVASENAVITVKAFDGALTEKVAFKLPQAYQLNPSKLRDVLLGNNAANNSVWYLWDAKSDNKQEPNYQVHCMGYKFLQGNNPNAGTLLFNEGRTCPSEDSITQEHGTWRVDEAGKFIIQDKLEKQPIVLNGVIDLTADKIQPRIKTFEVETQVKAVTRPNQALILKVEDLGRATTLFAGVDAANNYWNSGVGSVWINGKNVNVRAISGQNGFDKEGEYKALDLHLYFDTSCEDLGFKKTPDFLNNGGMYLPDEPRFNYLNVFDDGLKSIAGFDNDSSGMAVWDNSLNNYVSCDLELNVSNNYGMDTNFKFGQSLTIQYFPKTDNTDEEFVINTALDRQYIDKITPKGNLNIDQNGIFTVAGEMNGVIHFFKDSDGKLKQEFQYLEDDNWISQDYKISQYKAHNGNYAYQVFDEEEPFTMWLDVQGKITLLDFSENDFSKTFSMDYFFNAEDAKSELRTLLNKKIPLTGTTWKNYQHLNINDDLDVSKYEGKTTTMSFIDDDKGTQNGEDFNRSEMPTDFPICMHDENCNLMNMNLAQPIKYCAANEHIDNRQNYISWEDCSVKDKFFVEWTYEEDKGKTTMIAEYVPQNIDIETPYKDVWVKQ